MLESGIVLYREVPFELQLLLPAPKADPEQSKEGESTLHTPLDTGQAFHLRLIWPSEVPCW